MSVPAAPSSSGVRVLTEPVEPTGMKAGVSTSPCAVMNRPARAALVGSVASSWNWKAIESRSPPGGSDNVREGTLGGGPGRRQAAAGALVGRGPKPARDRRPPAPNHLETQPKRRHLPGRGRPSGLRPNVHHSTAAQTLDRARLREER